MEALDSMNDLAQSLGMSFPALQTALEVYFGEDAEIASPEDETEAWKALVHDFRDGLFQGLLGDIQRLLTHSDMEIFNFLRSVAPSWSCESPSDARRGVEVFLQYVEAYTD